MQIYVQRRKNRPMIGYKTLACGEINLNQVRVIFKITSIFSSEVLIIIMRSIQKKDNLIFY